MIGGGARGGKEADELLSLNIQTREKKNQRIVMVVAVCKERPERPMAGLDALGGDEEGHEEGLLVFRQMKKLVELAGVDGKVQVARQVDGIAELRQAKVNQEGPRKKIRGFMEPEK